MAYLRESLKDGSAKSVIHGLSQSGDHYNEVVATLRAHYDCPRLVHQKPVQMIVEAHGVKEGTGRELWRLHYTVQQHLRPLRSMDCESSEPFITSLLMFMCRDLFPPDSKFIQIFIQGHANLCRFIQVHAVIVLACFFYSLSREFYANPGCSSASLPDLLVQGILLS